MQASNFDQVHINASILYSYYSPIIANDVSVSYLRIKSVLAILIPLDLIIFQRLLLSFSSLIISLGKQAEIH